MKFGILGPLQVCAQDGRSGHCTPRQAKVLAVLLLAANQTVARQYLIDAVWDSAPPATAKEQLKNCVSELRRRLASYGAPRNVIVADGPGYRIRVASGQLDAQVFQDHLTRAQASLVNQQLAEAAALLRSALVLWRGPALAGCHGRAIEAGASRLDELRLTTMEQCFALELQLGRHDALVGELTGLVATHPVRERLIGQLMLALHRSGRQADALAVYQRLRMRLAEDLGLDPGAELQRLHTAILRGDAAALPAGGGPRPENVPAVPQQLPATIRHFTGRRTELATLTRLLDEAVGQHNTVVISAIDGTGGIGKTALAVHWARGIAGRFPDGQLYVNLRGFDPTGTPMTPAEAIRGFLASFAVPVERVPAGLDAQAALYRSLVAGRRVLVVLDNARDTEQVRPLLPGSAGCLVVVTSRNQLTGLLVEQGAHPLTLALFTTAEAQELLASRIGRQRLASEPAAVHEIIARCARLPLALAIVAARAVARPHFPLVAFAAELADTHRRLDALEADDPRIRLRAVFSWSYQQLSTEAARMFRLLGLHPGPDISVAAAASLAGTAPEQAGRCLAGLATTNLVAEHTPDRYGFHDLLRAYAAELARARDTEGEQHAARHRMLDHYLHTAHAATQLLYPHRDPIALPPIRSGVTPEQMTGSEQALVWFTAERPVLVASVEQSTCTGFDAYTWKLAWAVDPFLDRRGYWRDYLHIQRIAHDAARRQADTIGQAHAHSGLSLACIRLGRYDEAHAHLWQALHLFEEASDRAGQARTRLDLSLVLERQNRHREALDQAQQALGLYWAAGHRAGQARALNAIGWDHAMLGDYRRAIDFCRQALPVHREIGNHLGEAATWDSLGYAHHHLGHHRQATTCYRHALALNRDAGDRYFEADTLTHLGDAHQASQDINAAHDAWRKALCILDELNHPDADRVRARLGLSDSEG